MQPFDWDFRLSLLFICLVRSIFLWTSHGGGHRRQTVCTAMAQKGRTRSMTKTRTNYGCQLLVGYV